jgi:hypothetical protein
MGYAFCWVYYNNTTMLEVAWIFMSISRWFSITPIKK